MLRSEKNIYIIIIKGGKKKKVIFSLRFSDVPDHPKGFSGEIWQHDIRGGEDVPEWVLGSYVFPQPGQRASSPPFCMCQADGTVAQGGEKKGRIGKHRSLVEGHSGALRCVDRVR